MRPRVVVPGALVLGTIAAALCGTDGPGPARAQDPAVSPAGQRAVRLARALADHQRRIGVAFPVLTAAGARRLAERRSRSVPLPAAGRFSGIRWETAQADLTPGEVERVLQANARCQWLRAAAASREAGTAHAVLAEAAGWPAFRDEGPVAESALLLECVASHAREVAYARRLGLPPSS